MSVWRAARLVSQLPPESAVGRATGSGLTSGDTLLYDLANHVRVSVWLMAKRVLKQSPPSPQLLPPLASEQNTRRRVSTARLIDFRNRTKYLEGATRGD